LKKEKYTLLKTTTTGKNLNMYNAFFTPRKLSGPIRQVQA